MPDTLAQACFTMTQSDIKVVCEVVPKLQYGVRYLEVISLTVL